jgi:polyisoprenoid-binding protein YceI
MKRLAATLSLLVPVLGLADTSTWNFDTSHTATTFAVKHLVITTVRGQFGKTVGKVVLDDQDVTKSVVEATIDTTTIETRVPQRDAHLKSADFFEVEKYPAMTFKSTKVEKAGDQLKITGDLVVKGQTKPITFDASLTKPIRGPSGDTRFGFTATTKINRKEYGLTWSKAVEAGPVVGDEVSIAIEGEAIQAAAARGPTS